jgi:hypothetical protein
VPELDGQVAVVTVAAPGAVGTHDVSGESAFEQTYSVVDEEL